MTTANLELGYTQEIIDAAMARDMLRNQLAYVLATAFWETNSTMIPVKEAYWLSEEWREANLEYYPWYGRGFAQLTWEDNYQQADDELDMSGELMDEPDLALEPRIAGAIIILGMTEGWFTGSKLKDYITLQKSDFINARRIINGTDHASDIASIASEYDKALLDMGYGVDGSPQPEPVPDPTPSYDEMIAAWTSLNDRVASLEAWAMSQGMEIP